MPGDRKHHSEKWHRCVEKVMAEGHDKSSAAAICTASLQKAGEDIFEAAEDSDQDQLVSFHLRSALGTVRTEMWNGKEHLVIPVIALQEGVIHAVNAENPEFVPERTLIDSYDQWNGHPIVVGHPVRDGRQCSAHDDDLLQKHGFGLIRNAKMAGKRLSMEVLADPERLEALGQKELLDDLRAGKQIEVSVGVFARTANEEGDYNGKKYKAKWLKIFPDHLAFLPGGRGACSIEMGCGAHRAASQNEDELVVLGGPGSGNFGHSGRPGEIGGSSSAGGGKPPRVNRPDAVDAVNALPKAILNKGEFSKESIKEALKDIPREEVHAIAQEISSVKYSDAVSVAQNVEEIMASYDKVMAPPKEPKIHRPTAGHMDDGVISQRHRPETESFGPGHVRMRKLEMSDDNTPKTLRAAAQRILAMYEDCPMCNGTGSKDGNPCEGCDGKGEMMKAAAGARHSASDISMIQDMHDTSVKLGAKCADKPMSSMSWATLSDIKTLEGKSLDERIQMVNTAVQSKWGRSDQLVPSIGGYVYAQMVYDDYVIVRKDDKLFSVPYSIVNDEVVFGEPKEVRQEYVAAEAAPPAAEDEKVLKAAEAVADADRILEEKAAAGQAAFRAACGCQGESKMTPEIKSELIKNLIADKYSGFVAGDEKMLEAASDERLESFKVAAESRAQTEKELKAAAERKMTTEEFMAAAPPEIRGLVERTQRAETERKTALVTELKAAQSVYSEAELSVMGLPELEKMARLAKVNVDRIDYSGRGIAIPRSAQDGEDYTPPNAYEEGIKTLQAQRAQRSH